MFEIQLAVSALRKIPRRPSHFRYTGYIYMFHAQKPLFCILQFLKGRNYSHVLSSMSILIFRHLQAVIKSWRKVISPGSYERGPQLVAQENRRKIEPKEIPGWLIPHLLVVFTWQLEILMTSLHLTRCSGVERHNLVYHIFCILRAYCS